MNQPKQSLPVAPAGGGGFRTDGLRCELVRGLAGLERLAAPWRGLAEGCPWATPFQLPEWLLPFARAFEPDPSAVAVRRGRRLVGLGLFQAGDGEGEVVSLGAHASDYHDLLALPGEEEACWSGVLGALAEAGVERVRWLELRPESQPPGPLPAGWRVRETAGSLCPVLSLRPGRPLEEALPASRARRLAYARRRAAREGALSVWSPRPDEVPEAVDRLVALHGARWSERGEDGLLAKDEARRFHRQVAEGFGRRGELMLLEVRLGDRAIGAAYGFRWNRTLYYYLGGFDPEAARLSPGLLAIGEALDWALAHGCRRFDFLRGEEPYKLDWGARPRPSRDLVLESNPAGERAGSP